MLDNWKKALLEEMLKMQKKHVKLKERRAARAKAAESKEDNNGQTQKTD